jgi:hypothetical protein
LKLTNLAPTDYLKPDELEVTATPAQLDRIARYQADAYYPVKFERGNNGRLILTLERRTSHLDGRKWVGRIKLTLSVDGDVMGSIVLPCELITEAAAIPIPSMFQSTQPEPTGAATAKYSPGQRVQFCCGEHDELTGTLGTVEQVGGVKLLVRSDQVGLVTVAICDITPLGDPEETAPKRKRRPARSKIAI